MEKVFKQFWKNSKERNLRKEGAIDYFKIRDELEGYVNVFSNFKVTSIGPSLYDVGFINQELQIPRVAFWTSSYQTNLNLVKLLVLKSIGSYNCKISLHLDKREKIHPRLVTLSSMGKINQWLDYRFPKFESWENKIIKEFKSHLSKRDKNHWLYSVWEEGIASRSIDSEFLTELAEIKLNLFKKNNVPPSFLHATVPMPCRKMQIDKAEETYQNSIHRESKNGLKKGLKENKIKNNDSQEKKINPVMHSFEKLETLDDYDGANKISSGDDELHEHSNALDELELNSCTTEGVAKSMIEQDRPSFIITGAMTESASTNLKEYWYPEWSISQKRYWQGHCRVVEEKSCRVEIQEKDYLLNKYGREILIWKKIIRTITNEPIWKGRQLDGSELDIDQLIRNVIEKPIGYPKIYANKIRRTTDLAVGILADTSYSTDTYVQGIKVIDLIRESIGIAGLLLEEWLPNIHIASTNSATRKYISYNVLKDFTENWKNFYSNAWGLVPNGYTRLGPSIRHAKEKLVRQNNRRKLLILITDAKPTDLDPYEGRHGQEDVRQALLECKKEGIYTRTIVFSDASLYSLRHMFGQFEIVTGKKQFCTHLINGLYLSLLESIRG
ncbi:MAG: hypothetical protein M9962_10915 [Oligoflexia bacterium]|nr:hypothetical protein [Oligoflexia bacterium]